MAKIENFKCFQVTDGDTGTVLVEVYPNEGRVHIKQDSDHVILDMHAAELLAEQLTKDLGDVASCG